MANFAVVDLETTGLTPVKLHRVIEIGVVLTDGAGTIDYEWSTLVNPSRDLGPTPIHGVTGAMVASAPVFADVAGDLSLLLNGRVLVAHNARFDVSFLEAEWGRLGRSWSFESLCTMRLARRRGLPGRLGACCEETGIANEAAHHALGDARATAMLLARLAPTPQEVPGPVRIPPVLPEWSGRSMPRSQAPTSVASSLLPTLIARLPDAASHGLDVAGGAVEAYREVLDHALEDRILSASEVEDLATLADSWNLTLEQVQHIHESYLMGLVAVAAADNVFTDAELTDLSRVGALLGVSEEVLGRLIAGASSLKGGAVRRGGGGGAGVNGDLDGASVCFTGTSSCSVEGQALTRETASLLAAANGLTVVRSVTKKLDVLVVADPESQSGKARKARDYGTRIMVERSFWAHLGVAVD